MNIPWWSGRKKPESRANAPETFPAAASFAAPPPEALHHPNPVAAAVTASVPPPTPSPAPAPWPKPAQAFAPMVAPMPVRPAANTSSPEIEREIERREAVLSQSTFFKHWQAIKAEGITASQFIEFLQPFADLDGISVSYVYSDADGRERIYNHRREDSFENPLSVAIKEKKISKDEALSLALNEEGRVWIESNFMDLT